MTTRPLSGTYAAARKRRGRFLVPLVILLGIVLAVGVTWEWYARVVDREPPITQGCSPQYGPFFDRAGELLDQQQYETALAIFEVIGEIEPE